MIENIVYEDYVLLTPKTVGPIRTVGEITFVDKSGKSTKRKVKMMEMVYFDLNQNPNYQLDVIITPCRRL